MAVQTSLVFNTLPPVTVAGNQIISNSGVLSSSLDGSEIALDVAEPILLADDDTALTEQYLSSLQYGTSVDWLEGSSLIGKLYVKQVVRVGSNAWQVHLMSALGLLDDIDHLGGIYSGKTVGSVLAEIIGDAFSYEVDPAVAAWKVYGWLPYSTARNNLHLLLLAYGINIGRSSAGLPRFQMLPFSDLIQVPDDSVYSDGSVTFRAPATAVAVTEHTFWALASTEAEVLFDNTDGSGEAAESRIVFTEPHFGLAVSSGLTIVSSGVNYAVLSGTGVLTGKRYCHSRKVIRAASNGAGNARELALAEDGLIGPMNSYNVASRLLAYYSAAKEISGAIVLSDVPAVRPGMQLQLTDSFGERSPALLSRMDIVSSSTLKARYRAVTGYTPAYMGPTYNSRLTYTTSGSASISASGRYRFTLIGGGDGGQGGGDGEAGAGGDDRYGGDMTYLSDQTSIGYVYSGGRDEGGSGGAGGAAGSAGKVLTFEVNLTAGMRVVRTIGAGGTGGAAGGGAGGLGTSTSIEIYDGETLVLSRSSDEGVVPPDGFFDVMGNNTYASPGTEGSPGGDGGMTSDTTNYGWTGDGAAGGDAGAYAGGAGGVGYFEEVQFPWTTREIHAAGGGGGGSAVGTRGAAGTAGKKTGSGSDITATGGNGGKGANASSPATPGRGGGGNGGHGGGGGGNAGGARCRDMNGESVPSSWQVACGSGGSGGAGSAGSKGGDGLVVAYRHT